MSSTRWTEQSSNLPAPGEDNGKKTVEVFAKDDPANPGTTVPTAIDSDGNVSTFVGPQGVQGDQGIPGPTGPPGTLAVETVADINNPTELEVLTLLGVGSDVIAHQVIGAGISDVTTNYLYDADGPAKNAPFVMNTGDGGTTRWVAAVSRFTQTGPDAADGSRFISNAEIIKLANLSTIKEKFFSPNNDIANFDDYSVRTAGSTAQSYFTFLIPEDFVSLVSLDIILFITSTIGPVDIDLISSYALVGQDRLFNAETDTATTYNFTASEISEIDASVVFSSLVGGHICGLHIDHNAIGGTAKYLGLKMRYNV